MVTNSINNCVIIAIDGTSASGKGTVAKKVAEHYGYDYLDTGALYRRAALGIIERGLNERANIKEILDAINNVNFSAAVDEKVLHTEYVGNIASFIAAKPEVRAFLNRIQYDFPKGKVGVVIDGRDIGVAIFPMANFKFFITADLEIRAQRRYAQLKVIDKNLEFKEVLDILKTRDERDTKRTASPTIAAKDAVVIDTSNLKIEEVFKLIITLIG